MERDAGDEMVREMFLNPATAGDGDDDPLLAQAVQNVEDQAKDNHDKLELEQARRAAHHEHPNKEVDGIIFASGPEPKEEK